MTGIAAIAPILLALVVGYIVGRVVPGHWRRKVGALLGPLVLALLFSIGLAFGGVLRSAAHARDALGMALWLAAWTTMASWALITMSVMMARRNRGVPSQKQVDQPTVGTLASQHGGVGGQEGKAPAPSDDVPSHGVAGIPTPGSLASHGWWGPTKECATAVGMVIAGVLANVLCTHYDVPIPGEVTAVLLLVLVGIVGMELAGIAIDARWWSRQVLAVPILVIAGSLLGGTIASALTSLPYATAWALSSGFGWFTLSGVMIGQHLGAQWGAVALLTDLFRELLSIVLLYLFGRRFSQACIGASAATALDSTLPIIKQHCAPAYWPTALVSGFVLSLAAPVMMTLFLL
jgi:uncharacterized membrane protein YbjE (DUF340 family)